MTLRIPALLCLVALLALPVAATAGEMAAERPYLVKVHADWCGTCVRLDSTWKELQAAYDGKAELVRFDVTDRDAIEASRKEAERLGLTGFFEDHKAKTGIIAVLDAERKPVEVLKGETDLDAYGRAFDQARSPDPS